MSKPIVLAVVLATLTAGCAEMHFVSRVNGPERGGTIAYRGDAVDEVEQAMRDYCPSGHYDVLEQNEGHVTTGAIATTNFGITTVRPVGHNETYVSFKCKSEEATVAKASAPSHLDPAWK